MTTRSTTLLAGMALAAALAAPASAEVGDVLLRGAVEGFAEGYAASEARQRAAAREAGDLGNYPPGTVVVSCYRGPLRETIWDHPEPVFIDSLVAVGYDYGSAGAIAERVCEDELLVGDPSALQAEVARIMAASPARR